MTDAEIAALSTAQLDALLKRLATARINRPEPQPAEPPNDNEWTIVDPAWRSVMAPNGFSIIGFKHNAFGWVQFALPPHERASVACLWLRHQIVPPPPTPSAGATPAPAAEPGRGGGVLH